MTTIEALRIDIEKLSIERYMSLTENEKKNIESVKIVPPSFDYIYPDDDFGKFEVKYKVPFYKIA